ncbi:metal-dependent transcriptional regulator [Sediminivirga luteola]|uniref:DtxR family transcriptional regulator n=1 Tax=Sediminivirga luteola TaxID=1774748 RepID=A0A8J2TVG3_9MICO|nr:metal-dependent transcriptional regulator [Sediminivirga luteola]MCI2265941.1 metal-dependent transcriptional regulator [Sediminivirga luteola]GGA03675.1 DtxR family transcriptional regulator [Sediminivirga luteola]
MNDLVDTTEMYLKAIIELEEESIVPLRARISERLGHSGPTVSQTVARMERDGLLVVETDRHLQLTERGRKLATEVMRKHRLAERLLSDVIGLEWELLHDEACRWEHVMSQQVEEKLLELLPVTSTSPYGNPIPGLDEIGGAPSVEEPVISLLSYCNRNPDRSREGITGLEVAWLGEPIQVDAELLSQFKEVGILPGAEIAAQRLDSYVSAGIEGGEQVLDLPDDVAVHVFIKQK